VIAAIKTHPEVAFTRHPCGQAANSGGHAGVTFKAAANAAITIIIAHPQDIGRKALPEKVKDPLNDLLNDIFRRDMDNSMRRPAEKVAESSAIKTLDFIGICMGAFIL
jgi:hypothetical protein